MPGLSRSYAFGASATPLLNQTIGETLEIAARRWPDQDAVVVRDQNARLSFAELLREADRLAAGFIALGLKPGERIGIWSPNKIEWVLTQFAAARAGLILVCVNPAYRLAELRFALNNVECRALVTAVRFKTSDYIGMLRALAPELASCAPGALRAAELPHLTTVIHTGESEEAGFFSLSAVRGLGGAAEVSEAGFADDGLDAFFAGLRAKGEGLGLGHGGGDAKEGGGGVEDAADGVEIVFGGVVGEGLDDHPGAVGA